MGPDFLKAVSQLIELLIRNFGPWGTVGIFAVVIGGSIAYRIFQDWRREKWMQKALDGKEETIQRLAAQDREWRIYFMVKGGMNRREAEKIVQENQFLTPKEAREALEGREKSHRRKK